MKRFTWCSCLIVALLAVSPALAQDQHQHESGGAAQQGDAAKQEPSAGQQPMMCGGMMGQMAQGQMSQGMMGPMMACCGRMGAPATHLPMMHSMMHQMMGGQTDPTSIGMTEAMGAGNMETKTMGRMLQMRGEMLKAIGEIMLRHGKAMEEEK